MVMEYIIAVVDATGVRNSRHGPNIEILEEAGFLLLNRTKLVVTEEQAAALTSNFPEARDFLSGPVVALQLKKDDAYETFAKIRHELTDIYASCDGWSTLRDEKVFFPTKPSLERTLVVVKPEYTQEDYSKVLQTIEDNDFVLIDRLSRIMTPDMAKAMFSDKESMDYMTSDVSMALVVEKVDAVDEWSLLLGPADPELAKQIAPKSLRAQLGKDKVRNAVYGSSSAENAERDIGLRFPGPFAMERTLALIKPDVVQNGYLEEVLDVIAANGFTVLASERLNLSAERVEQLFAEHKDKPTFPEMARYMRSGPCMALVLGKPGALGAWSKLVGPQDVATARTSKPDSLRARFATGGEMDGFFCSADADSAAKEINAYFPQLSVEKIPSLLEVEEIMNDKPEPRPHVQASKSLNDVLVDGLTQLCRIKPVGMDAVTWLGEWLLQNNPNKPTVAQPVVEEAEVTVAEAVQAKASDPEQQTQIIWAVGAKGSGRDEQCNYIVKNYGYEFIDVGALIAATEASGNEYGELIKECKRLGKAVPTHVTTNLIKEAILGCEGSSKFLVNAFPSSLDEAFDFESRVGDASMLLYFDCSDGTRTERLGQDAEGMAGDVKEFKEAIFPVVDHYATFSKICKISTDGSEAQVTGRVARIFR